MFGPLRSDVVLRGRRKGCCTLQKVSKTWGFCSSSKNDGRRGTFEEDQGADFLRWVALWSIRSWGLLRWFCVTGAALRMTWHHFCVAGAAHCTHGMEKSQNTLVRGRKLCTQLSILEGSLAELLRFWCCRRRKMRKSRRIVSFLMLSSSKSEEFSQICCVFDVAKVKN